MTTIIPIGTQLRLVQLRPQDSRPLFELIEANREHLSQLLDETSKKYPSYESVFDSILNPPIPAKLRFGIWVGSRLIGSANLLPGAISAEVGYWLSADSTGSGYATLVTDALCEYAFDELGLSSVIAFVHRDNVKSQRVLERCGLICRGPAMISPSKRSETALMYNMLRPNAKPPT